MSAYGDYFETCRRKRNVVDYTRSHVATDREADEIVTKAQEFYELVEGWSRHSEPPYDGISNSLRRVVSAPE